MSMTQPETGYIPQFTLKHRIALAMEIRDLTPDTLAERLDMSGNAVRNWVSGRSTPQPPTIRLIADECAVSRHWLELGIGLPTDPIDELAERRHRRRRGRRTCSRRKQLPHRVKLAAA